MRKVALCLAVVTIIGLSWTSPRPQFLAGPAPDAAATVATEADRVARIMMYARSVNPTLSRQQAEDLSGRIVRHSENAGVDPLLTSAVVGRESRFRPQARGAAGEIGLMQLLPVAARAVGVSEAELASVDGNLRAGTRYLAQQVRRYGVSRGLAAYNGGPNGWRIGRAREYAEEVNMRYQHLTGSERQ